MNVFKSSKGWLHRRRWQLTAAIVASGTLILAGCSSNSSGSSATTGSSAGSAGSAASSGGAAATSGGGTSTGASPSVDTSSVKELTIVGAPSGLSAQLYAKRTKDCGDELGVTINLQTLAKDQTIQKVLQEASGGKVSALVNDDIADVQALASTGLLEPLDKFGFSTSDYYPNVVNGISYKGHPYGMPDGINTIGLFYNEQLLNAAGITQPPATWDELTADAKKLTSGNVKGLAYSAPQGEEATWQWEPIIWSNGGKLVEANSPQAVQALDFWTNFVKSGYTSQSVLNWSQADIANEFVAGHVAMVINGPWNLPLMDQAKFKYGIAPIPVPKAGSAPTVPFGGGALMIAKQKDPAVEQKAWDVLQCMQKSELDWIVAIHDAPAKPSQAAAVIAADPRLKVFVEEIPSAKARTDEGGLNYPRVSAAIATAIQQAISNSKTPQQALGDAQQTITGILNG